MKRLCLTLAILLIHTISSQAQSYQSIFGDSSTEWVIKWENLDLIVIDTFYVDHARGDIPMGGKLYKYVYNKVPHFREGWLLREDTSTGQVWFRNISWSPSYDTSEQLCYDFSKNEGDTFDIRNDQLPSSYPDSLNLVDSVRIIGGLKYIYFKGKHINGEPITLIEGIGCNLSPIWKTKSTGYLSQYLLCSYKDGVKTSYVNKQYKGECRPSLGIKEAFNTAKQSIQLYPNPTNNIVHITYQGDLSANISISLSDITGRKIQTEKAYLQKGSRHSLDLSEYAPGVYMITISDGKQLSETYKVIKK